jgi:hypothetical protein
VLDPRRKLPIVRYDTGDIVELVSFAKVQSVLADAGRSDLLPEHPFPLAFATGKFNGPRTAGGEVLSEQQVKEALYADLALAPRVTGNFRLTDANGHTKLAIQLAPGVLPREFDVSALDFPLRQYGLGTVEPMVFAYEAFSHGLTHDYERKCKYWGG